MDDFRKLEIATATQFFSIEMDRIALARAELRKAEIEAVDKLELAILEQDQNLIDERERWRKAGDEL